MDGVILTPLKKITHFKGDILHAMKKSEKEFSGFGEAYFSSVYQGKIKGWKKHNKMTLNIIVVQGEIEFVVYDNKSFFNVNLSKNNFQRLTVGPGLWLAFRGLSSDNMLLNLASIEHDPKESENKDLKIFPYDWHKI
jgi:dTDP-4-dehydrorhamnose 3,5-epimerase